METPQTQNLELAPKVQAAQAAAPKVQVHQQKKRKKS